MRSLPLQMLLAATVSYSALHVTCTTMKPTNGTHAIGRLHCSPYVLQP